MGSDTGFSYSGNVSIPSFRSSLDDCIQTNLSGYHQPAAAVTSGANQSGRKRAETYRRHTKSAARYLLFDHHDSVVVHATSITATAWMLSHSADSSMTHGNVSAHRPSLSQPCYLFTNEQLSVSGNA